MSSPYSLAYGLGQAFSGVPNAMLEGQQTGLAMRAAQQRMDIQKQAADREQAIYERNLAADQAEATRAPDEYEVVTSPEKQAALAGQGLGGGSDAGGAIPRNLGGLAAMTPATQANVQKVQYTPEQDVARNARAAAQRLRQMGMGQRAIAMEKMASDYELAHAQKQAGIHQANLQRALQALNVDPDAAKGILNKTGLFQPIQSIKMSGRDETSGEPIFSFTTADGQTVDHPYSELVNIASRPQDYIASQWHKAVASTNLQGRKYAADKGYEGRVDSAQINADARIQAAQIRAQQAMQHAGLPTALQRNVEMRAQQLINQGEDPDQAHDQAFRELQLTGKVSPLQLQKFKAFPAEQELKSLTSLGEPKADSVKGKRVAELRKSLGDMANGLGVVATRGGLGQKPQAKSEKPLTTDLAKKYASITDPKKKAEAKKRLADAGYAVND